MLERTDLTETTTNLDNASVAGLPLSSSQPLLSNSIPISSISLLPLKRDAQPETLTPPSNTITATDNANDDQYDSTSTTIVMVTVTPGSVEQAQSTTTDDQNDDQYDSTSTIIIVVTVQPESGSQTHTAQGGQATSDRGQGFSAAAVQTGPQASTTCTSSIGLHAASVPTGQQDSSPISGTSDNDMTETDETVTVRSTTRATQTITPPDLESIVISSNNPSPTAQPGQVSLTVLQQKQQQQKSDFAAASQEFNNGINGDATSSAQTAHLVVPTAALSSAGSMRCQTLGNIVKCQPLVTQVIPTGADSFVRPVPSAPPSSIQSAPEKAQSVQAQNLQAGAPASEPTTNGFSVADTEQMPAAGLTAPVMPANTPSPGFNSANQPAVPSISASAPDPGFSPSVFVPSVIGGGAATDAPDPPAVPNTDGFSAGTATNSHNKNAQPSEAASLKASSEGDGAEKKGMSTGGKAGLAIGIILILALIAGCVWYGFYRKGKKQQDTAGDEVGGGQPDMVEGGQYPVGVAAPTYGAQGGDSQGYGYENEPMQGAGDPYAPHPALQQVGNNVVGGENADYYNSAYERDEAEPGLRRDAQYNNYAGSTVPTTRATRIQDLTSPNDHIKYRVSTTPRA